MSDIQEIFFRYGVYYPVVFLRGQAVPRYLRTLLRSQHLSSSELSAWQNRRLTTLMRHAGTRIPHYQRLCGTDHARPWSHERLRTVPPVTKQQIRSNEGDFRDTRRQWMLTPKTTGGSTGQPMTIWKTREAMAWELAAMHRGYLWAGVAIGDRQARFWGVPQEAAQRKRAALIDRVTNRYRASAFAFTRQDLEKYHRELTGFRPTYAYGYVSMLEEFAGYLTSECKTLPSVGAVIATSEVLGADQRGRIQEGFGARVFNEYGCGELGTIAHECESGSMHINAENLIVEILDGDRPCDPGEEGEIVVTELHNTAMPLIRYRTGDIAAVPLRGCPCGRALPVIDSIHGRAYDVIANSQGRKFHPEFFMYMVEDAKRRGLGIAGFQLVERGVCDLHFRIMRDPSYSAVTEEFLRARIHADFDSSAVVTFSPMDSLPRERSGKVRVIKSAASDRQKPPV